MQIIYIDTLLAVNLFIDYLLLCLTKKLLHINAKNSRLLIGASAGAILSLCIFIPIYSVLLSAMLKILSAVLVAYISFGNGSFRQMSVRFLTFMIMSMVLSTSVVLINNFLKPTGVIVYKDSIYIDISPKILLISTAVTYLCLSIYHKLSDAHKINTQIHKVTFMYGENMKLTFESAVDTGCKIKEPFSGLPVIFAEESLISGIKIDDSKMRIIPYSTMAGSDLVMGFKPSYLAIDNKEHHKGCYIGICKGKLKGEIKSIMGPELLEVI